MKAVVTDPQSAKHLALAEVDRPTPSPSQALVRIAAFSLNRGEVRQAFSAKERYTPGWDVAGTVEQQAADGSGPEAETRVVGFMQRGGWAEYAAVPTSMLARLPEQVSFSQAATLPVAGMTALYAIEKAGGLLGRRVLVTGASGGVGDFAVQLAYLSGAAVVGITRHAEYAGMIREGGAEQVVIGDPAAAANFGPYDLICDGVGGETLSTVAAMVAPGGVCVSYAATIQPEITVHLRPLFQSPSASLTGLLLLTELRLQPATPGLARLAALLQDGRLKPHISVEAPWNQVAEASQRLIDREFAGKAVLLVS